MELFKINTIQYAHNLRFLSLNLKTLSKIEAFVELGTALNQLD
jgi:hypothetical protein